MLPELHFLDAGDNVFSCHLHFLEDTPIPCLMGHSSNVKVSFAFLWLSFSCYISYLTPRSPVFMLQLHEKTLLHFKVHNLIIFKVFFFLPKLPINQMFDWIRSWHLWGALSLWITTTLSMWKQLTEFRVELMKRFCIYTLNFKLRRKT